MEREALIQKAQASRIAPSADFARYFNAFSSIGSSSPAAARASLHALFDLFDRQALEIITLTAGQNRNRNFIGFRCRQNKDDVGRRLLQGF